MDETTGKRTNRSSIFYILIAGGLFLLGAVGIAILPDAQKDALGQYSVIPAAASYPAPEITLTDLDGNSRSLLDFRNLVVLVNNWATWCPPCKAEMPALQAYYSKHAKQGFTIIGIDSGESADVVGEFVKAYKLTFPILLDPAGVALEEFNNFDLPSSYLIDRDGIVRLKWTGPISESVLEKYVTPLLEK